MQNQFSVRPSDYLSGFVPVNSHEKQRNYAGKNLYLDKVNANTKINNSPKPSSAWSATTSFLFLFWPDVPISSSLESDWSKPRAITLIQQLLQIENLANTFQLTLLGLSFDIFDRSQEFLARRQFQPGWAWFVQFVVVLVIIMEMTRVIIIITMITMMTMRMVMLNL